MPIRKDKDNTGNSSNALQEGKGTSWYEQKTWSAAWIKGFLEIGSYQFLSKNIIHIATLHIFYFLSDFGNSFSKEILEHRRWRKEEAVLLGYWRLESV